jgi:hypothetical protein
LGTSRRGLCCLARSSGVDNGAVVVVRFGLRRSAKPARHRVGPGPPRARRWPRPCPRGALARPASATRRTPCPPRFVARAAVGRVHASPPEAPRSLSRSASGRPYSAVQRASPHEQCLKSTPRLRRQDVRREPWGGRGPLRVDEAGFVLLGARTSRRSPHTLRSEARARLARSDPAVARASVERLMVQAHPMGSGDERRSGSRRTRTTSNPIERAKRYGVGSGPPWRGCIASRSLLSSGSVGPMLSSRRVPSLSLANRSATGRGLP